MGAGESKPLSVAPTVEFTADQFPVYDPANAPFWQTDCKEPMEVLLSKEGVASEKPCTLIDWFRKVRDTKGDKAALAVERPCPAISDGKAPPALPLAQWKTWTYKQYYEECAIAAKAMMALGLEATDGVNIYGFNAPEWFMGQLSGIMAGGIAGGIYPSDTPEQLQFKSRHSGASIAVCETRKQAEVFLKFAAQGDLPKLKGVIVWDAENVFDTTKEGNVTLCHWSKNAEIGKEITDEALEARISAQSAGSVMAYIYTSGTTGNPKAVMITHDNVVFVSNGCMRHSGGFGTSGQERVLSYLPLSHVAGMMIDISCPLSVGANFKGHVTTYFARAYDLKIGSLVERLKCVRPTLFLGVPRVWEKIAEKMKAIGAKTTGLKKSIGAFGKNKGLAHAAECQMGGSGKKPWFHGIADSLVLSKISDNLGLNQVKLALTGAAPITKEILQYFGMLGISINECYGMSESTGATTWSSNDAHIWGSCGWAVPGTEVKCFKIGAEGEALVETPAAKDLFNPTEEEQGELCFRGRHIMAGYMANPDLGEEHVAEIAKKNADAIDKDGWMHSGDKGCIDARGMVRVTGRYKELIITAGGENVAPVPIEDAIKATCDMVSNVMMIGDQRKFNVALVTLKCVGATGEVAGTDQLDGGAKKFDSNIKTVKEACQSKKYTQAIIDAIVAVNKTVPSNACKIQKFSIVPRDFSVENGELTPTLKLKRGVVTNMHVKVVDSMYESKLTYVPYSDEYATAESADEGKMLKKFEIVPDVFKEDPGPVDCIKVAYEGKEFEAGAELTPKQSNQAPTISYPNDKDKFYTLVLTDPDAPARSNPLFREFIHWVVTDIPGDDVSNGTTVVDHLGPAPPHDSGLHRYVFLAFEQEKKGAVDVKEVAELYEGRGGKKVGDIIQKYNLKVKAAQVFQAQWGEECDAYHTAMAWMPPADYQSPTQKKSEAEKKE